ncbi:MULTISPECIES: HAD family hydrolase [unclassified Oceanispirochaeta]|uniref:HAD family hydrolase n=1 Tax=unclassified Oceanispirochaeta TaxID=2635722 RepID=UPI000E096C65|nr:MULTISPECIES: HAD family hydrolase [unclassified Oceanispirochaeta]MBF9014302.1 HAD family hydrolase [Oceanispirochaeta sp. M2]NPD71188.1 HAD family hydrolase [Oceanispirochaeta sp. M1]RDG33578.1 HAD family hydrolase [Oceanispirochaeta sp. M1]
MRKQALIFDHDGTLVDSIDAVVFCTNQIIKEAGYAVAEPAEIRHGMAYATLERFTYHTGEKDPDVLKKMSRDFYVCMNEQGAGMVSLYPGIKKALDRLARDGFSIGLLTNNQGIFTRRVAAQLKYSYDMEIILGEDNVPAPKPDPRGLLQACAGLGAVPENCWYIGDGKPDFEVARNAGLKSALVTWGAHPKEELLKLGADRYFDTAPSMADFFTSPTIPS